MREARYSPVLIKTKDLKKKDTPMTLPQHAAKRTLTVSTLLSISRFLTHYPFLLLLRRLRLVCWVAAFQFQFQFRLSEMAFLSHSVSDHLYYQMRSSSATLRSNLQGFLHSVTPIVPSKPLPQSCISDLNSLWHPAGKDEIEYFTLGDLWECYDEWSAYGAGTPVVLNNGEQVVQYYVPYLSAIQIFTNKSSATPRTPREDTNAPESESESWSDDSESDNFSRTLSNNSSKTWDANSLASSMEHEGSCPLRDRLGYLCFQYYDTCSPYWRIPLLDKINEFAQNYPGIMTLRSVDLSPASWMAVAWYPIYHIPTKGNLKELSACFLTYHTLSSSFQDTASENGDGDISCSEVVEEILGGKSKGKSTGKISLPPFGLATYKMQGNLWMNPVTSDHERLSYLHSAADSWLKQLNVQHHDYNFFTSHSTMEIGMSL
ncbi:hypothetical protein F0562_035166 [Nyssa sinensis]|uniref:DUF789 domain-containing protein n=1 Tax=Nyssa sinensis TaxID=561372 RepID=A0A5J5AAC1_9ASTE|nr:hypothetical protein F0562_035166 [Nyssa sinensis]